MAVENVNYCVGLINCSCSLLIYSRKDTYPLNSRLLMNWFPTILGIFIYLFVVSSSVIKKINKKNMSRCLPQCSCPRGIDKW